MLNRSILTSITVKQNSLSHVSITTIVSTISTTHDKVKDNLFSLFKSEDDARLWILKMNDHFHLSNISDLYTQVIFARSYFHVSLRKRTQRLRLTNLIEFFSDWTKLQTWLLKNYEFTNTRLKIDLTMNRLIMWNREAVQQFINRFESVIANLNWNEFAVCAAFRKRLNQEIVDTVHLLHSNEWLTIFAHWKKLSQEAENHLKIEKRTREKREYFPRKRVRFDEETNRFSRLRFSFKKKSNNVEYEDLSDEEIARRRERRRRREKNLYLNCEKSEHWTDNSKCINSQFKSKNSKRPQ